MRAIGLLTFVVVMLAMGSRAAVSQNAPGPFTFQASPALVESARSKDFDALVLALSEDDQEHSYYVHPLSGGGSPNSRFHMMLRDCRIAKLRSYIQANPAAEQAALAEQLFDAAIEAYDATFKQQIGDVKVEKFDSFMSRHDAVLAMLLLCSEVCEPQSVLQKVDYMKKVVERHGEAQTRKDTQVWGDVLKPDSAYLKNLYLYFLEIRFPGSSVDVDVRFALAGSGFGQDYRREIPIVYWDLKTNSVSKALVLHDTCRLSPEFEGMAHGETDTLQEKRLRVVVDRYVAKSDAATK
jgi:hypothetical protein